MSQDMVLVKSMRSGDANKEACWQPAGTALIFDRYFFIEQCFSIASLMQFCKVKAHSFVHNIQGVPAILQPMNYSALNRDGCKMAGAPCI